jgi:two-component system response regulator YesN
MNTKLNHIQNWPELAKQANWSVREMAKLCDISVRSLELYFLKNIGKSPKTWSAEQRQMQASDLLRSGLSVKETAALLGYRHAHHLSREFKKYWGHYPTQMASSMRNVRVLV